MIASVRVPLSHRRSSSWLRSKRRISTSHSTGVPRPPEPEPTVEADHGGDADIHVSRPAVDLELAAAAFSRCSKVEKSR